MNPNSSLSADELRHVSGSLKRAHMSDHLATAVFYVVSGAFVLLLIAFTMYVVWGGIKAFRPEIFSFEASGIGNQFFNTVYLVFLSLVISVPIGIFAGVYMAEYAPEGRIIHALRIAIETLSSLPSIVVGLLATWSSSSWSDPSGTSSQALWRCLSCLCRLSLRPPTMH